MKQHLLLSFLLSLSLLSLGQNIPSYVPNNGLVGWWPFNGNANDESGNGNHGVVSGAMLSIDRFGNLNNSFAFNSSSSQYISTNIGIIQSDLTFSLWFKAATPVKYYPCFLVYGIGTYQPNNDSYHLGILGNEPTYIPNQIGKLCAYTNSSNQPPVITPGIYKDELWHHFLAIYKPGDSIKIYIDGIKVNSVPYIGQASIINGSLFFGRDPLDFNGGCNACGRFAGQLDDISIFSRALTQQEITNLYNASVSPPPCNPLPSNLQTGLVGYWPFCGNANDESGNENSGTVNGATLTVDRFGDSGKAYSFDGIDDNIIVANSNSIQTNTWTISSWFKTSFLGYNRITSKDSPSNPYNDMSLIILDGKLYISSSSYGQTNIPFPICNEFVADNSWHSVVAIRDSGYYYIYIDGTFCSSVIDNFTNLINNEPLYIGSPSPYPSQYFNGKLDDIAIWNRALSSSEVTYLYQTQTALLNRGNIGVNVDTPLYNLHIKDVMKLEPRSSAPANPTKGVIYFDEMLNKLRVYDGSAWQNCW